MLKTIQKSNTDFRITLPDFTMPLTQGIQFFDKKNHVNWILKYIPGHQKS
jgi:hypothetical protein